MLAADIQEHSFASGDRLAGGEIPRVAPGGAVEAVGEGGIGERQPLELRRMKAADGDAGIHLSPPIIDGCPTGSDPGSA